MICPRCDEYMSFDNQGDHTNWFKGLFYCELGCEFEATGTRTPQDYDYIDGDYKGFDCADEFDQPNGGYNEDAEADAGCYRYHQMKEDGEL